MSSSRVVKSIAALAWLFTAVTMDATVDARQPYLYPGEVASGRPRGPDQYIPDSLRSLLVVITAQWNVRSAVEVVLTTRRLTLHSCAQVAKLSYLEVMLTTAVTYRSPETQVLLVTDKPHQLRAVVDSWQLPLNTSFFHGEPDPGEMTLSSSNGSGTYAFWM